MSHSIDSASINSIPLQAVASPRRMKQTWVAIVLLLMVGGLGFHRFYLRRYASGAALAGLTVGAWLLTGLADGGTGGIADIATALLVANALWRLADLVLIRRMVRAANASIR
jgi:TM2 domain-containing membrane protein YozV